MNAFISDSIFAPVSINFPKSVEEIADSVYLQKLLIPFYDRKRTVSVDEIVRLEGCGNYTNFYSERRYQNAGIPYAEGV